MSKAPPADTSVRDRWIVGLMGGLFALVGIGFAVGTLATWREESTLASQGSRVSAVVMSKHIVNDEGKHYYVSYMFRLPSGAQFDRRRNVTKDLWGTIAVGDTLPVRYDPADPQRSIPEADGAPSVGFTLAMTIFSLLFAAFGAVLAISAFRSPSSPVAHRDA